MKFLGGQCPEINCFYFLRPKRNKLITNNIPLIVSKHLVMSILLARMGMHLLHMYALFIHKYMLVRSLLRQYSTRYLSSV